MTNIRRPVNVALVFYATGFVLLLASFVTPNWIESRHGHDTWGLWQECEFGACRPLLHTTAWYSAFIVLVTAAFASAALSLAILLVYTFASTIPDFRKRWILYSSCICAVATVILTVVGVVIIGSKYHTLGGHEDVFGNTVKYDLDACLIVACVSAGAFLCGVASLAYFIYKV